MGMLQSLINSVGQGLGNDIFIFIGLYLILLVLSMKFGLPLPLLFVISFIFTVLVGVMTLNDIPLIPESMLVMFVIMFGLVLGMLTYFFFYRRG